MKFFNGENFPNYGVYFWNDWCIWVYRPAAHFYIYLFSMPSPAAPVVEVTVMLMRFLGLHGVPFKFYACSDGCKERLVSHYTDIQKQLKDEIDREYDENVQAALKAMKNGGTVDISPNTINAPADQVQHFTAPSYRASSRYTHRSRRKKCTIMWSQT